MPNALRSALALAAALLTTPARAAEPGPYDRAIAAGYKASLLCEGIFTAARKQADVETLELTGTYPEYEALIPALRATSDRARHRVTVSFDPAMPPRLAVWRRRLGCSEAPIGATAYDPPRLARAVPLTDAAPWPLGDVAATAAPQGDAAALARAVDAAFTATGPRTTGVVVLQHGRIVAERYAPGFDLHTPNRTWSVAKSLTATLVGLAAARGLIDPAKPAALPEWSRPGDPRSAITVDQLLRMASGLHSGQAGNRTDAIYFGGATIAEDAGRWPLEAVPGTRLRVIDVLSYMAAGDTLDDMQQGWPYIARESFQACLLFAAERSIAPVFALAAG